LHGLDEPSAKQGHKDEIHAVEASKDATVTAANDGFALPEYAAEEALVIIGVPS
jgi:hypothetical protein